MAQYTGFVAFRVLNKPPHGRNAAPFPPGDRSMNANSKPKALVVTALPPDLRAAFAARCELADAAADWPRTPAPGFAIALTTSMRGMDAAMLAALPDLKLVLCQGAGIDRLDLAEAHRRGVAVCHTPDELTEDVAEAAIALTFAIMRRVAEADRFVRAGRWPKERIAPSTRVAGKTMGIVGLGRIGREIARRAEALGMTVLYFGRRAQGDVPYRFVPSLHELAEQADVLVLSCPGGEATRNLVDTAVLARLGPKGYLINISRGSVVDEPALIEALTNGTIAGAGLDVFATEPAIDPRFAALENVVLEPHSSSITHETRKAIVDRLLRDLDAFLNGQPYYDAAAVHARS
jgi:lactate dehydrogenase-like 2-hydroxyacid dehydrogenase